MKVEAKDLRGPAREAFDTWRSLGLSESAALEELCRDGLVESDPFDEMVSRFRHLGLSEDAARTAAIGSHRDEASARRSWENASSADLRQLELDEQYQREFRSDVVALGESLRALQRAIDAASDEDLAGPRTARSDTRATARRPTESRTTKRARATIVHEVRRLSGRL